MLNEAKCCTATPRQPMRDCISTVADALEKSNDILESIEGKLFGLNQGEDCEKSCPPQNVQNGIDRADDATRRLISRLDSINTRL
jgi:hypothetical protein